MKYNGGRNEDKNWIVIEDKFDVRYLGKCESIMCQGNGYLGVRAALEESYGGTTRNTFVAGTFNKFAENEVTELPNVADVVAMDIEINGEPLNLSRGEVEEYSRSLNLKSALLERRFIWKSTKGDQILVETQRFVSMDDKHLIGQRVKVKALNQGLHIKVTSGIDGQVSNEGVQHFLEGEKRAFDSKYIQANFKTTESNIDFVISTIHKATKTQAEKSKILQGSMGMKRRVFFMNYETTLQSGETICIEKYSNVYTSRDKENKGKDLKEIQTDALEKLKLYYESTFEELAGKSKNVWEQAIWNKNDICIKSKNEFDQLAIRFAIYHIYVMTPLHDNRMNIGAKGLSGEGYKGHTFWDTEMFLLPYFIFSNPNGARSLLEYRYKGLEGARKKADSYGFEGAMYPWESAWIADGEVTPQYGAVDIVTGELTKIWSGIIEQHITSDVAFAVWQYYEVTGDQEFMDEYGYEMIFDTANFWQSRLEWKEDARRYEICNVIGPDEYKEHKNNNAFTNYMAHWNMEKAIQVYQELQEKNNGVLTKISEKIGINQIIEKCQNKIEKMYIPVANEKGLIPQDDTYLTLPNIDLTKYKNTDKLGQIIYDYNLDQMNEIQVSKQADTLLLFYLLEHLFDYETKKKNFYYYEDKCLHDSSLSLSTHSILASDLYEKELAYNLFERACRIDLGESMTSSDMGIHAASFGGVWQCIVMGFVGVRIVNGELRIEPRLPEAWDEVKLQIMYRGEVLKIQVNKNHLKISCEKEGCDLQVKVFDKVYGLQEETNINII